MKERGKKKGGGGGNSRKKTQGTKTLKLYIKPANHVRGLHHHFQSFSSNLLFTVAACFN